VNSPPPKLEVILTNFFAEPTVLLVPITSRDTFSSNIVDILYHLKGSLFKINLKTANVKKKN
jgi:hypothetical protein